LRPSSTSGSIRTYASTLVFWTPRFDSKFSVYRESAKDAENRFHRILASKSTGWTRIDVVGGTLQEEELGHLYLVSVPAEGEDSLPQEQAVAIIEETLRGFFSAEAEYYFIQFSHD
jgi:hypothetical protein